MKYFLELNPEEIKGKIILLDVDGTLVIDNAREVAPQMVSQVKALSKTNKVFLCSNNKDHQRNNLFCEILEIESVSGVYRKPNPRIADLVRLKISETFDINIEGGGRKFVVIGDKVLIDGVFAKLIKAEFIHVKRLVSGTENLITRIAYKIDNLLSVFLK